MATTRNDATRRIQTDDAAPASEPAKEAAAPAYAQDPHAKITVSLSEERGGASMHLLRSQKFNQMQIKFDGEQPGEKALAMLKDAGWRDRTEAEGVFTKQIDKQARWQSVQQMEREFTAVANAIREEKGLSPALAVA